MLGANDMFNDIAKVLVDEKVGTDLALGVLDSGDAHPPCQVPVVETAGSSMPVEWKAFKDAGMVVIHKCTSIRHALRAQKSGVDAISMDGFDV